MIDRETFDETWRVACPRGHRGLEPAAETTTAYCPACGHSYDWAALIDRKTTP